MTTTLVENMRIVILILCIINWIELFVLMYNDIIVQKNKISIIEGMILLN